MTPASTEALSAALRRGRRDAELLDGREFDVAFWDAADAEFDLLCSESASLNCPACDGLGFLAGAHTDRVEQCQHCNGTGRKKAEAEA